MNYLILLAVSFVGGIIGFRIALYVKNKELAIKDKELELEKKASEERKKDTEQLGNNFKAIAGDVLRLHSKDFLDDFEKSKKLQDQSIENKEKGFERIAEGVNKTVESVEKKIAEFEKQRDQQIGALGESIKHVLDTGNKMQETALTLKNVLSSASAVRGRWGEAVLKNLLEESGLTEGKDFLIQETISGDESATLRPDVIINLPGGLQLAIDSKAGLEEFFKAVEEKDAEKKKEHIDKFAQNLRGHIKTLSSKEYQNHLDKRIPYVVMFIPGEAAVRAVFEQDANLYSEAQGKRVMLASPATIMPLILLIAHAWRQHKSVENAQKITEEVMDLGSRLAVFLGHIIGIGGSLSQATKKFNQAASSWDTRVSPKIEQINNLGVRLNITDEPKSIEEEPRPPAKLSSPSENTILTEPTELKQPKNKKGIIK